MEVWLFMGKTFSGGICFSVGEAPLIQVFTEIPLGRTTPFRRSSRLEARSFRSNQALQEACRKEAKGW
jgi:hypothetical protein